MTPSREATRCRATVEEFDVPPVEFACVAPCDDCEYLLMLLRGELSWLFRLSILSGVSVSVFIVSRFSHAEAKASARIWEAENHAFTVGRSGGLCRGFVAPPAPPDALAAAAAAAAATIPAPPELPVIATKIA